MNSDERTVAALKGNKRLKSTKTNSIFQSKERKKKKRRKMKTPERNHARYSRNICDSKTSLGFYGSSCAVLFLN